MSEHDTKAPSGHSRFGGSVIGRVIACPGSAALAATVPEGPSSVYAEEGTLAHAFAEYFLQEGERDAIQHIGATLDGKVDATPFSEDMARAVQVYLDAVWAEVDASKDAELYVEQRFVFDKEALPAAEDGEVYGANDAMVYSPSAKRLTVFDYKHGQGVSVSAEDNSQLKFYACGALLGKDWPIAEIELVIVQPRARDAEENNGGVKRWSLDVLEVLEFTAVINDAVAAAKGEFLWRQHYGASEATEKGLNAGSHCRWCPAKAVCPALERGALDNLAATVGPLDFTAAPVTPKQLPAPKDLDTQRIANIMASAKVLRDWLTGVEGFAESLLISGVPVPGFKLVEKIGRRQWTADDESVAGWLTMVHGLDEADVRPPSLCTITEATRLLKQVYPARDPNRAKAIEDLEVQFTLKESSGVTIAPESDKREAVDAAARAFGSVNLDGATE